MSEKYAIVNEIGEIIGRYDSAVNNIVPDGAIRLTDEEFAESIRGLIWINPDSKEIIRRAACPSVYHTFNGEEWVEDTERREADEAEAARVAAFKQAQESSGADGVTVEAANDYIDSVIDPATNLEELKTACKNLIKKMFVFLVRTNE